MPNTEQTFKKLPKINNILKKWRNFAKSGHTEQQQQQLPFNKWPSKFSAFICFILAYPHPDSRNGADAEKELYSAVISASGLFCNNWVRNLGISIANLSASL